MNKNNRNYLVWFCIAVAIKAAVCLALARITDHFDFQNFYITGEIAASGKNVYASMKYYNYGPAISIILGMLFRISSSFASGSFAFKTIFVGLLILADLITAVLVSKTAGKFWGLVFFINPISTYVIGYQTQFDNIAVMLGAWGVYFLRDSAKNDSFSWNDVYGTVLLSLSLIVKHFMWAFPLFILLNTSINSRKKFLYAFVPPLMFLLSFVPYIHEGLNEIINNVFMYRSGNNFPLFALGLLNITWLKGGIAVYAVLMLSSAYLFRNEDIYHSFLIYTMSAVCFASGIYSQQFVIPCLAVIVLFRKWSSLYFLVYLARAGGSELRNTLCVWCLLAYLVYYYFRYSRRD